MAVINSLAIGKARKSAGNLTYKVVRGRTIASQKITENKSNTIKQSSQRNSFAVKSKSMKLIQAYIDNCYEKTKYGSARNRFARVNNKFNLGGVFPEISEGAIPLAEGFLMSLSVHPDDTVDINYVSDGSLSCIVSESLETYPTVKIVDISETPFNDIRAAAALSETTFTFPSGVRYSDLELVGVGFFANSIQVVVASVDSDGIISSLSGDFGEFVSGSFSVTIDEVSGMVSSVRVKNSTLWSGEGDFAGAVLVPRVGGKLPQTRSFILGPHTTE